MSANKFQKVVKDANNTHSAKLLASENFIGLAQLLDRDNEPTLELTTTIKAVTEENFEWGEVGRMYPILEYAEGKRRFKLNATNKGKLDMFFGKKTENWIGKRITHYWDPKVRNPSGGSGGVRVKRAKA